MCARNRNWVNWMLCMHSVFCWFSCMFSSKNPFALVVNNVECCDYILKVLLCSEVIAICFTVASHTVFTYVYFKRLKGLTFTYLLHCNILVMVYCCS
jgi:hypothetical protein